MGVSIEKMNKLLFGIEEEPLPDISGLTYVPDFISAEEERALIVQIDALPWLHDLKRRVQHYGYKYDYKARAVTADSYLGPLPEWVSMVSERLVRKKIFSKSPEQLIVNDYLPGQGISAHIDCVPCFGDTIASVSLNSGVIMQFSKGGQRQEIYLKPRSLVLFSGSARYDWAHAIPARKSDSVGGFKIMRERRISLTFRTMILN